MTFRQFAFNNVLRNKRTYAAYFLSSAFSVMVFFVYAVFAFHPDLAAGNLSNSVSQGLHFAESIIYVFSFFFVLYSMSAFLKTRKKEFGLLVMHGMTQLQLRTMVFLENVLIGFFSTLTGIGIGLVFAKVILLAAERLLDLDNPLPFYIPVEALLLTFAAFLILFVVISLFTVAVLRGNSLVHLIRGSQAPKTEPKASPWLSLLAAILLVGGYIAAFWVEGLVVVGAMIPVTLVVIAGTYFLFTQLSVYLIRRATRSKAFFWRKTNMLLMSDLTYRMKDNARTFFMVAILSTVAFSAIGSLVGFRAMSESTIVDESPFAFQYSYWWEDQDADRAKQDVAYIGQVLKEENVTYELYEATIRSQPVKNPNKREYVVRASEYNAIASAVGEQTLDLKGHEAAFVYYSNALYGGERTGSDTIELSGIEQPLKVTVQDFSNLLPLFTGYYVIPDPLIEQLDESKSTESVFGFYVEDWEDTVEVGRQLSEHLPNGSGDYFFNALAYDLHTFLQGYSAIMFVGLFMGAVFFVGAGSFLYFRLYTDLDDDKQKFRAIVKLGLTDKELSKVITRQLMLLFFVPIGVAIVHGAVALNSLSNLFHYPLVRETALVLGSFLLVQIVYFLFIRSRYLQQIRREVYR
ncbi:FtsX-like permease family protein [Paenibacillus tarimensis]|uniref:FtsX-like permease family protein n=1 Tax=Paenibacillus tarimensis TaxID=416012 RepID=UPI001F43BC9A|nr:ABC transporter permease [Paenibacillus tarimensis]MCF2944329.1 ABC transporter permease [Paenibacillus tarimensis]